MFKQLNVYVGCMFSGKSTKLMQLYEEAPNDKLYVKFTTNKTDYMMPGEIKTHGGKILKAFYANSLSQIPTVYKYYFLDEIHLAENWDNEWDFFSNGKIIYISTIDMYFDGTPIQLVGNMLCQATNIEKLHGLCKKGNRTDYTIKLGNNSIMIQEDEKGDLYKPVCKKCFIQGKCCS